MHSGLTKLSKRLEINDVDDASLIANKETNYSSPPDNTKSFDTDGSPKINNHDTEIFPKIKKINISKNIHEKFERPSLSERTSNSQSVLINIDKKKFDKNIEDNKTSYDNSTITNSKEFPNHVTLVQNNFVVNSEKTKKKENILEQEFKQIHMNYIGNNTTQNFYKTQYQKDFDVKTFQIKVDSPLTITSHRHKSSNFSIDSNRIFLRQNKENSIDSDRNPNTIDKRSISYNNANSQSQIKSNLIIDTVIQIPYNPCVVALLRQFLFSPIPKGRIVTCNVQRKKLSITKEKFIYIYYIFLNENDRFVMASYFNKNKNCYCITTNIETLDENQEDIIGCVYSNYFGTEFNIFDQGKKTGKNVSTEEARINLGTVRFEVSFFGLKNPRKVSLYLPKVDRNSNQIIVTEDLFKCESLASKYKQKGNDDVVKFKNKVPEWCEKYKKYLLDFNGRVERGSKKNFQMVDLNDPSNVILQFGKKKSKNQYSMDFTFPLSPRQAFGVCLSTLAGKLASQ